MKIEEAADRVLAARRAVETAKIVLEQAKEAKENAEGVLLHLLDGAGLQAVRTTEGVELAKRVDTYPRVKHEVKFFGWLRKHGSGGIIKQSVHVSTLRAWFREATEEDPRIEGDLVKRGLLTISRVARVVVRGEDKNGEEGGA